MKANIKLLKGALILFFLSIMLSVNAKEIDTTKYHELKVGDTMPDIVFKNSRNFPTEIKRFSDLKGKLVILEFGSSQCTSCLVMQPHLAKLQEAFRDKLIIIRLDPTETEERARQMFEFHRTSGIKINPAFQDSSTLPITYNDTSWNALFPHFGEPYQVWINSDGKIISLTEAYNATPEHVSAI